MQGKTVRLTYQLTVVILKACITNLIARTVYVFKDLSGETHPVELSMKQMAESLARTFYPAILEFFEKEENQKEFEQWLEKRKQQTATN